MNDVVGKSPARRRKLRNSPVVSWAVYWSVRLMLRLLSLSTLRVNHMWGSLLGRVMWHFNFTSKQIARCNLQIAYPDAPPEQIDELLRKNLIELGKTITEFGILWRCGQRRLQNLVSSVEGRHVLQQAQSQGKGIIFLSPHLGSWELVGLHLSINSPITSMYRPAKISTLDRIIRPARERFGARLVPTELSGVVALRRTLAERGTIGVLPDQDPGPNGGIDVPFFGYSARTMLLVSRLAAKSGAPVLFVFAERLPKSAGFRIIYRPAPDQVASRDEEEAARALNEGVEHCVEVNPAQYQWSYNRYRFTRERIQSPSVRISDPEKSQHKRAA